jgi:hypothetical protein
MGLDPCMSSRLVIVCVVGHQQMDLDCRPRHNIPQIASAYRVIVLKKGVQYVLNMDTISLSSKGKLSHTI